MSIERRVQVIPANGRIEVSRGNYFLLLSSTVAVNLRLDARGTSEGFDNITGGVRIRRVIPWDTGLIIGAAGGSVEYMVGHENVAEDDVDVFLQVATVAGTVAVVDQPSATVDTPADNALAAATTEAIAANPLRQRITIGCLSTNSDGFRVQAAGAVDLSGVEIQPGQFAEFRTRAALDIRNTNAVTATSYYIFEES